jgi:serine/threonine protein kinase/Tfp pilus assembly protein PilF
MTLSPGTKLAHYEILEPIGKGGMGEVYRARDTKLGRDVAIKILREDLASVPERLRRFEQEAKSASALNHPNIIHIYDVGEDQGVRYIAMEYVDARTLREVVRGGPLPVEKLVHLAKQVAEGLVKAHSAGIVHRDLKPDNLMVTEEGYVKILDFGLAKLLADPLPASSETMTRDGVGTREGIIVGTVQYMSPEQARGGQVDARSDQFSLGSILYELATGKLAFRRDSFAQTMAAIMENDPEPMEGLNPNLPAELVAVVQRCLSKDPDQRYGSTGDLAAELKALAENLSGDRLAASSAKQQPSIAVLPFSDLSAGRDHDWFSDGLTEEIINSLTRISGLKVIARTSAFAFKDKQEDVRGIARQLGVTNVLEGSVRTAGNRIRVTAQLVGAADGSHLWSERYDRELMDIFAIQDDIAQAIASALQVKLSPEARDHRRHTPSLEAYGALLKARQNLSILTPQSLLRSKELFEQAIALDPEYALPRCELGWSLLLHATENLMPSREAAARMKEEGRRALEIDPSFLDAHGVSALAAVLGYDWQEAGKYFELTRARDAIPPFVRYYYAVFYLAPLGRTKEAEAEVAQALEEDPLNFLFRVSIGMLRIGSGREEEGEIALREVLELNENVWIACHWLCSLHVRRGEFSEALNYAQKAFLLVPQNTASVGMLAGLLTRAGDTRRAEELLARLGPEEVFGVPAALTVYHAVRSELDLAADWFEKLIVQRDTRAPWILSRWIGAPLMSSSRWPALARMMNLPQASST